MAAATRGSAGERRVTTRRRRAAAARPDARATTIPSPSSSTKKARANGEPAVRARTCAQSTCSRSARGDRQQRLVAQRVLVERHQLRDQHVLERHHAHVHGQSTDIVLAAARAPRRRPARPWARRSGRRARRRPTPSAATPPAGRSARMPAATSASSARSASASLSIRSRSWRVSGPPRAQLARLPPSRNGMLGARAARRTAFFSVASRSANGWLVVVPCPHGYPA